MLLHNLPFACFRALHARACALNHLNIHALPTLVLTLLLPALLPLLCLLCPAAGDRAGHGEHL